MRRPARTKVRVRRIITKFGIFDQMPEHIDAKAIDAFPKPETHDVVDGLTHSRIAPVQIGLLRQEGMIVILPCTDVVAPCAAAKLRHPIVRSTTVGAWLAPQVPVPLRIVAGTAALDKPRMLVRGMVRDEIEDH